MMERELVANGVDVSGSGRAAMPSGQGLVLLQPGGAATSIVLWGANTAFAKVGWGAGRTSGEERTFTACAGAPQWLCQLGCGGWHLVGRCLRKPVCTH